MNEPDVSSWRNIIVFPLLPPGPALSDCEVRGGNWLRSGFDPASFSFRAPIALYGALSDEGQVGGDWPRKCVLN